nr:reverse transcriptase domain-containing protein [Tanacetum cinerariifolium]
MTRSKAGVKVGNSSDEHSSGSSSIKWVGRKGQQEFDGRSGEFVFQRNEPSGMEDQGNLGPKWEGPYRVMEAYENGSYKLETLEDKEIPQTWHAINL